MKYTLVLKAVTIYCNICFGLLGYIIGHKYKNMNLHAVLLKNSSGLKMYFHGILQNFILNYPGSFQTDVES